MPRIVLGGPASKSVLLALPPFPCYKQQRACPSYSAELLVRALESLEDSILLLSRRLICVTALYESLAVRLNPGISRSTEH